jgi:hypothetical protein
MVSTAASLERGGAVLAGVAAVWVQRVAGVMAGLRLMQAGATNVCPGVEAWTGLGNGAWSN